jgi:hypothetical protein
MSFLRRGIASLACLITFNTLAQESVTQETNAPGVKFYQINTPHFRFLYPEGFEQQAQRMANTFETIREPEARTMGALPRRISFILQTQSSVSNGFVTLAPWRSELYTMPSQNYNFIGTNDWLTLLASHEYRHVVQFQRSITGFNKFFYYLFGQQALAGLSFAAAPQWFWEGDAVATETAFTQSGRGRIPYFDMVFRTNLMEGRTFNYHKQYLRSYKHNIPNHYVLGYNMVSYLRRKTNDPMIWEKVLGRSWNVPFIPFAFSNALKAETGLYVKDLYKEMAAERKKDYESATSGQALTKFETITKRKSSAYTDYFYPQPLDNGNLLVMKSGIGDIEQLVVISKDGKEEKRYVQGPINDAGMLSATNQRVVWNEFRFDPRWLVHTFSVIKGFDFGTKQARVISGRSRFSAAALSPDGYRVATVETTDDYKIQVLVLDYFSGKVLARLANPGNDLLSMPRWTEDGKNLVVVRANKDGKTISLLDVAQNSSTNLMPVSQENIGYPVPFQNYILFNSSIAGIDNIYAFNVDTKERFQVTVSKYGALNPAVTRDGKSLYYNDQTRNGLDVVKVAFEPDSWKPMEAPKELPTFSYQHLVEQEGTPHTFESIPSTQYATKRYHRISGMINPHSWGPYFVNSLTEVNIGIVSQDILSTTTLNAGYTYDINERAGRWQATASYQGQFPIIDVSVALADRSVNEGNVQTTVINGATTTVLDRNLTFKWHEENVEAGLRIPLLTTSSKYNGNITFGNSIGYTHVTDFTNSVTSDRIIPSIVKNDTILGAYSFFNYVGNGNLIYNHFGITGYRLLKQSRRDINPKWGQTINLHLYNTPFSGSDYSGQQLSLYGIGYVPGFFKHHSIWGYFAYQQTQISPITRDSSGKGVADNNDYQFRNGVPLPRGQSVSRLKNYYGWSVNYTLPLWYPDIAAGPLVNLQRVRGNGFFDYGYGKGSANDANVVRAYSSVGGEVKFDINVLRFLPQFNVGFRYTYGISPRVSSYEILIGSFNF